MRTVLLAAGLMWALCSVCARPLRAEVALSRTTVLAPHYATGDANLDDDRNLVGGTLFNELSLTGDQAKLFVDSELQYIGVNEDVPWQMAGREAWVEASLGPLDVRAGRQVILWGRADRFNPTDAVTPSDFRFLTIDRQGQRFGATGIQGQYFLDSGFSVSTVLVPIFVSSILPGGIVGSDAPRPHDQNPDVDLLNPQVGIRLDRSGGSFDGSLSYYHGYATSPLLKPSAQHGLAYENPRIDMVGGDFAFPWEGWAFRGEAAYTRIRANDNSDEAPVSNVYAVVGVEHSLIPNTMILVQWLHRTLLERSPASSDDPFLAPIGIVNAGIYSQFDRIQNGMSVSVNGRFLNDALMVEIAGAAWFNDASWVFRPNATYAIDDHWKIAAVLDWFGGPHDSNFGILRDNNRFFMQLRYAF